jgi:hypothetical protein
MRTAELRGDIATARNQTLQLIHGLSWEQMRLIPGTDRWSVAMVLDHLEQVDAGADKIIRRMVGRAHKTTKDPAPTEYETRFDTSGSATTIMSYPVYGGMAPSGEIGADCVDRLDASHESLLAAVEDALSVDCAGQRFPHPVVGPMTTYEWIAFVSIHEMAHHTQLEAIIRDIGGSESRA